MDALVDSPGIYVASIAHAEAHLSAVVQHVLAGGVALVYDGRQPAMRHVYATADPPLGQDLAVYCAASPGCRSVWYRLACEQR